MPPKPSNSKPVIILLAIAAVGTLLWLKPWQGDAAAPAQPMQQATAVEAAVATTEPLDVRIESVGTLTANESVTLRPEVAGRITEILLEEGACMKKGAPLIKIDDRVYAAELKQAEAEQKLAELEYTRFKSLSKTGTATRRLFDQSQAALGVAQANTDLARTKLDYATIRAPFDGVVGLRRISPGDYVNVGQELANFVSYDPMKVDFTIPETRAGKLKPGQVIEMTVEALPGKKFQGEVYALDPQVDVAGRAVALRARVANPDNELKPGYFARISLVVDRKENALMVPEGAIIPQGNDKFVYKVKDDNTVTLLPVGIGERLAGKVEVVEGLQAGDRVVASGQIKLREGSSVSVVEPAPPSQAKD